MYYNYIYIYIYILIDPIRQGHAVAVLGDKAYLFGGSALNEDGVSIFYNDLFALNCKS